MFRRGTVWLGCLLGAFVLLACETEDEGCGAAKAHLCSKIEQQACMTSTMGNAVAKLQESCGEDEAERFRLAAESYCEMAVAFDEGTCRSQ